MNWRDVDSEVGTILIKGTALIFMAAVVIVAAAVVIRVALFVVGETVEHFTP
jgi:hypothetical protein